MDTLLTHCAGLDIHKDKVQACRLIQDENNPTVMEEREFSTFTEDLLVLWDWLKAAGVTHVSMESTSSYWRSLYNILEAHFELLLVNPRHVKNVPGRKTDVNGARWLAQLLQHGLLKPSFVPPEQQRILQDLTRMRTSLVEGLNRLVNRIQKTLEDANINLACIASDVMGISGRQTLAALLRGEREATELAQLVRGRSKITELETALQKHLKPIMPSFSPSCCARSTACRWHGPLGGSD